MYTYTHQNYVPWHSLNLIPIRLILDKTSIIGLYPFVFQGVRVFCIIDPIVRYTLAHLYFDLILCIKHWNSY